MMTFTVINKRIIAKNRVPPRSRNPHIQQCMNIPISLWHRFGEHLKLERREETFSEGHCTVGRRELKHGECIVVKVWKTKTGIFVSRLLSVYDALDRVRLYDMDY